jgi:hypothetical protein
MALAAVNCAAFGDNGQLDKVEAAISEAITQRLALLKSAKSHLLDSDESTPASERALVAALNEPLKVTCGGRKICISAPARAAAASPSAAASTSTTTPASTSSTAAAPAAAAPPAVAAAAALAAPAVAAAAALAAPAVAAVAAPAAAQDVPTAATHTAPAVANVWGFSTGTHPVDPPVPAAFGTAAVPFRMTREVPDKPDPYAVEGVVTNIIHMCTA